VVDVNNPRKIVWAGSKFGRVHPLFPVYASKYLFKPGSLVTDISKSPYEVDEVHGRGVLIPRVVIEKVGNYDSISFPHYGGDNDFSLRAKKNGVRMFINPRCRAKVYACNTSLNVQLGKSLKNKVIGLKNYLFLRKHGEALFVWWKLYKRHLPPVYFLQSYISVIVFNLLKKMRK
jgi:GT2 family glycosyltransferase